MKKGEKTEEIAYKLEKLDFQKFFQTLKKNNETIGIPKDYRKAYAEIKELSSTDPKMAVSKMLQLRIDQLDKVMTELKSIEDTPLLKMCRPYLALKWTSYCTGALITIHMSLDKFRDHLTEVKKEVEKGNRITSYIKL